MVQAEVKSAAPSPSFHAPDLATWRRWLKAHHATERVVWLVFHKKVSGTKTVSYDDALDEAICWGWIDSLVRRINENSYARKFTRRTNIAKWSPLNINRLKRLLAENRVQPAGRAAVSDQAMRQTGNPAAQKTARSRVLTVPAELEHSLKASPKAAAVFESLAPSHRRNYVGWVAAAKRAETRERRAQEAARLLSQGQKALLK